MENGRELVLYNLHLSAYTSDGTIATEQLQMLCADMLAEYENGNYCVAGGDFNKDLLGNSAEIFGVKGGENDTWAQPIPEGTIPDGLSLVVPFDPEHPVATCRHGQRTLQRGDDLPASRSTASSCPTTSKPSPPMSWTQGIATPTTILSIWISF